MIIFFPFKSFQVNKTAFLAKGKKFFEDLLTFFLKIRRQNWSEAVEEEFMRTKFHKFSFKILWKMVLFWEVLSEKIRIIRNEIQNLCEEKIFVEQF